MSAARAAASVDLPVPDRPPTATMRGRRRIEEAERRGEHVLRLRALARLCIAARMLQLVGRHQRPHAGAQPQAQRHGRQPLEVEIAGRPPQVAVEYDVGAQPPAAPLEVHQQKARS